MFKVSRHEQKLESIMMVSVHGLIQSILSFRCRIGRCPSTGVQGTQSVAMDRELSVVAPDRRVDIQ